MKYLNKILPFFLLGTLISSCKKDFLDRTPQTIITADAAYSSITSVNALTAKLYDQMRTEDLGDDREVSGVEAGYLTEITDEAVRSYIWGGSINDGPIGDGWLPSWRYDAVRNINDFIAKIQTATAVPEERKAQFLGEGYFIRAIYYFDMVKRYGGIPVIRTVQDPTDKMDSLQVPRNKEQDVYDFIAADLDAAISALPDSWPGSDQFRATKYAAYALKARAMLYAASIAKYGTVQLDGIVGIPSSLANGYWQKAYDAANAIISSGRFSLYQGNPDKVANFRELFLNGGDAANTEAIMVKTYSDPTYTNSFDFYNAAQSFKVDYGCVINPTLELVEQFENTDGTPGKLKVTNGAGKPILYNTAADLFANKDPRMRATVLYPGAPWQGGTVEIRAGIIDKGVTKTSSSANDLYPDNNTGTITINGKDGPLIPGDATRSGFYIQKFMDPVNRVAGNHSTTPWMIFRYAEVLLNYAEAAMELGKPADAYTAVKQVRDRAGIATTFTSASITLDIVRHERQVELAFENHRHWDLRRWRIAEQVLTSAKPFHALYPYLNWATMQYSFQIVNCVRPTTPRSFSSKLYYEKISTSDIAKDPNLIQNPGY